MINNWQYSIKEYFFVKIFVNLYGLPLDFLCHFAIAELNSNYQYLLT